MQHKINWKHDEKFDNFSEESESVYFTGSRSQKSIKMSVTLRGPLESCSVHDIRLDGWTLGHFEGLGRSRNVSLRENILLAEAQDRCPLKRGIH